MRDGSSTCSVLARVAFESSEEPSGASWLDKNGEGKNLLFLGDTICFADIQIASYFAWAKVCLGEDSKEWERILGWHGGRWKAISELFKQYETDV